VIEGRLKPYPDMKESGIQSLGPVPGHWKVRRLGQLGRIFKGSGGNKEDEQSSGVSCVRYGDLYTTHTYFIDRARSCVSQENAAKNYVRIHYGDVLFAASGETLDEIGKSAVNLMRSEACCGGDVIVFRAAGAFEPKYLGYLSDCAPVIAQKAMMGRGITVKHVYGDQLKYLVLPVPPLGEQAGIVRFLDFTERRIRRYIGAKQKLIKLLEEQKQGIVHRAVTRGLDPNVRLKPSGVEWLGQVPAHWDLGQIRSLARVIRGSSPRPAGSPLYFHGTGLPWITVGELTKTTGLYMTATATRLTEAGAKQSRVVQAGTLLLTNSGATLGVPKISLIEGCINDGVAALVDLVPRINKEFFVHYFSTQTVHLRAWVDLGAQPNLNTQIIGSWPVVVPSISEQIAIVAHIEQRTNILTRATARAVRDIALLRDYRTRLLADVVTGKLDVRDAAAKLPDEAAEAKPLDEEEILNEEGEESVDEPDIQSEEAEV